MFGPSNFEPTASFQILSIAPLAGASIQPHEEDHTLRIIRSAAWSTCMAALPQTAPCIGSALPVARPATIYPLKIGVVGAAWSRRRRTPGTTVWTQHTI